MTKLFRTGNFQSQLLLIGAIALIIFGVTQFHTKVELEVFDTFFISIYPLPVFLFGGWLLICAFLYRVTSGILYSGLLSWIHTVGTILICIILTVILMAGKVNSLYTGSLLFSRLLIILVCIQLVLVINILTGLSGKRYSGRIR